MIFISIYYFLMFFLNMKFVNCGNKHLLLLCVNMELFILIFEIYYVVFVYEVIFSII